MNPEKSALIRLAIDHGVLRFGQFTLKSGRVSPYFFNAGLFYKAASLRLLGQAYAQTIIDHQLEFEHLFGPAYKGIPLVTATAIALAEKNKSCTVTFNRKEEKDHGEGGLLIGSPLTGRTILIDDVISAGTAFRHAQQFITSHGGQLSTVIIILDRCERGVNNQLTLHEIQTSGIQVLSLITVHDLVHYLQSENNHTAVTQIENYLSKYGVP